MKAERAIKGKERERKSKSARTVKGSKTGSSLAARTEETRWPLAKGKHRPHDGISFGFYTAASRRGNVLAY